MKRNNKGFTLAELLIVVAIIAVLVAVAIPVLTNQLERSREATDEANIRSAYSEIMTELLTGNGTKSGDIMTSTRTVDLQQKNAGWESDVNLPEDGGFLNRVLDPVNGNSSADPATLKAAKSYPAAGNKTITLTGTLSSRLAVNGDVTVSEEFVTWAVSYGN